MAFTERELEISNKSYTNKDFAAIYEELLTTAEKLSGRFSPTTAVESDPFIVILKLAALVADKTMYNIDKNLLETFISSCTQEESMRELTETLGYNMRYYVAAETDIICSYKGSDELTSNIFIPKYSIVETASKIPYVTTMDAEIYKDTKTSANIEVIQGKVQSLTVLNNDTIQLENLNSNNRIYFPELMVAENGIFISNNLVSDWEKVNNLNTQTYGSAKYKFGFDSKRNRPYVEFPQWIADIIGEGLKIDYIVTQGEAGNVAAKELSSIKKRAVDDGVDNSNIRVFNLSAAYSGANPETLDQSYIGYKKIVGTFDTLVTCRDYANAIYNMVSRTESPEVSNVQVADRRTDINFACEVATFDKDIGLTNEYIPIKINAVDAMTPFDLTIYPFKPISNTTASAITSNMDGYNKSFELLDTAAINSIITKLDDSEAYKSINHTFKHLGTTTTEDIISIQNYYDLTATISTVAKVNVLEQADIISNIYSALAKEFNTRNLNFGYEIPFDELLAVIEKADNRIKSVNLQEPLQTPKIITRSVTAGGVSTDMVKDIYDGTDDSDEFKFIVAKNILGGRVSLFEYDLAFGYNYDYAGIEKIDNIKRITTECNIAGINYGNEYLLKANEVLQFISPNLISEYIFTAGVYYHLTLASGSNIPANTDYQLKIGDVLKFYYKENGEYKNLQIEVGKIINSKNILYTTAYKINDGHLADKEYLGTSYHGLESGDQVSIKKINSEEVVTSKKCYWITNEPYNEIIWVDNKYVLKENEYFFYSDINLSSLYAFGSGTSLTRTASMTGIGWDWKCESDINIDEITLDGLHALDTAFKRINFTSDNKLILVENEILTLTEGDTIKNNSASGSFTIVNNVFTDIENIKIQYKYKTAADFQSLVDKSSIVGGNWSCRSVLDINCGPNLDQSLLDGQEIYYSADIDLIDTTDDDTYTGKLSEGDTLKFNILMQRSGGENIALGYITINNLDQENYPALLSITKASDSKFSQTSDGMYLPDFGLGVTAKFYAASVAGKTPYMMIYASDAAGSTIQAYNISTAVGTPITLIDGINIIELDSVSPATHWQLEQNYESSEITPSFVISPIKYVKGINPRLGLKSTLQSFKEYMNEQFPEQMEKFYSLADLDPNKEIDLSDTITLNTAQAFYDSNNIANKWVLPKIDFSSINIKIARSSTK